MEISNPGKTVFIWKWGPGGCLNIKMPSYQYRDSHVEDKTVSPTVLSLTWESSYLGKTVFILKWGPGSWNISSHFMSQLDNQYLISALAKFDGHNRNTSFFAYGHIIKSSTLQARERERERLSLSAFLRTEDIGVHIVHISRLIITYT